MDGTNPNVVGYEVQWKTSSDTEYNETTTNTESVLLTNLVAGQTYTVRVRGISIRGNKSAYTTATIAATGDTLAPKAPTYVAADNVKIGGYRYVTISWTPPTQNSNNTTLRDLAGYEVYRSTQNSIPDNFSYRTNSDKFTDGGGQYWLLLLDQSIRSFRQ